MLILLVCSGNTCRSPLAAAMLTAKLGGDPAYAHLRIASAGTGATPGAPASPGAYLVGLELGLDLSGHRAQRVTAELIDEAELILTMEENHVERIRELGGEAKATMLTAFIGDPHPAEIPDPWGGGVAAYRSVAALLDPMLDQVVERLPRYPLP